MRKAITMHLLILLERGLNKQQQLLKAICPRQGANIAINEDVFQRGEHFFCFGVALVGGLVVDVLGEVAVGFGYFVDLVPVED
jgi:hypothetical protein